MRRALLALAFMCAGASGCSEPPPLTAEERAARRADCGFSTGDRVAKTLGISREDVASMPITHVIVRMQENRSFDHYFGRLDERGLDVDGIPDDALNLDREGNEVPAFALESACLEADPPHQWEAMHAQWNEGEMDGFVTTAAVDGSDGHYAMGHYLPEHLPVYTFFAETFALGDRYFSSSLGGTWSNRNFLYTGAAHGVRSTFDAIIRDAPTVFQALDRAGVSWGVFIDGSGQPRQDTLGWTRETPGVRDLEVLLAGLRDGTAPPVSFVDSTPGSRWDEHPPYDVNTGEHLTRAVYEAMREGPLRDRAVLFLLYDTAGGLYDHVPPPRGCVPLRGEDEFDQLGLRVPFVAVSAWSRPGFVSHRTHDHTSVLRFIEALHDLPALSARDANAEALLEVFDFDGDPHPLPEAPSPGPLGCRLAAAGE